MARNLNPNYDGYDWPDEELERQTLLSQMKPASGGGSSNDYAPVSAPSNETAARGPVESPAVTPSAPIAPAGAPSAPTYAKTALSGWDQSKWDDASHDTIKYTAGRVLSNFAPSDWLDPTKQAQIVAAMKAAGLNPTVTGKDTIDFGDGFGDIDILKGFNNGGESWRWGNQAAEAQKQAARAAKAAAASAGAASPSGASASTSAPGASVTTPTANDTFRSALLGLLSQDMTPTMDDPVIKAQADTYRADAERARRERQQEMAEQYAAQGLGTSGALDSEVASSFDTMGHDIATHNATLLGDELQAKRDMLTKALTIYGGLLTEEEQQALQWKIAQLEDQQAKNRLGYDYDSLEAKLNNSSILDLLGLE